MNLTSLGILCASVVVGLGGAGAAYQFTAVDTEEPAAAPAPAATPAQASPQQATRARWAPCTPPAVLEGNECVTDVVRTVTVPAEAPAAPASPAAPAPAAPDAPASAPAAGPAPAAAAVAAVATAAGAAGQGPHAAPANGEDGCLTEEQLEALEERDDDLADELADAREECEDRDDTSDGDHDDGDRDEDDRDEDADAGQDD